MNCMEVCRSEREARDHSPDRECARLPASYGKPAKWTFVKVGFRPTVASQSKAATPARHGESPRTLICLDQQL